GGAVADEYGGAAALRHALGPAAHEGAAPHGHHGEAAHTAAPARSPSITAAWARRGATQSPTRSTLTPAAFKSRYNHSTGCGGTASTTQSGVRCWFVPVGWCSRLRVRPSMPIGTRSVDCTMPLAPARIHHPSMSR